MLYVPHLLVKKGLTESHVQPTTIARRTFAHRDDVECESDREIACPAKRRKHDFFLTLPNTDEDLSSLSRSSSLLQFESLEKQCQEICNSSPSIYSQYSFDSLDNNNSTLSPNSLNSPSTEDEPDYYKTLKIDVPRRKQTSRDSLLQNALRYSGSDSSDSDMTLDTSRSFDNLKTWRSYESLPNKGGGAREKISVENLSEDSGYGDHLTKSSSTNNLKEKLLLDLRMMKSYPEKRNSYVGFTAYDGEYLQDNFSGNFGVSYQDLTSFKDNQLDSLKTSPLIDHFNMKKQRSHFTNDISDVLTKILKLDAHQECDRKSNYKTSFSSSSEPSLFQTDSKENEVNTVCVSSVPKDLNFISELTKSANREASDSVAAKDWNLADLRFDFPKENNEIVVEKEDTENMSHYKREGSYSEAMSNRVDLSDDEHSLYNRRKPKLPKSPIVEFDKRVLKAISEQSLQSILSSSQNLPQNDSFLEEAYTSTPISKKQRNVASTPNLALPDQIELAQKYFDEERRKSVHDVRRKGSIIKSSTSTSGMSDGEDKTLMSVKSFSGSANSKGVHFSPVVSEVNWRDDSVSTVTPDRESSYSLGSSSPERRRSPPKEIVKPTPRFATPVRLSYSQPDLSDNDSCRREFVDSLKSLREDNMSKSQPDVNRLRRRGSQLIKKDKDGSVIKAYVDGDGIQYKHTHLDIGIGFGPHHATAEKAAETSGQRRAFKPVDAMEAQDAFRKAEHAQDARKDVASKQSKASGKIGGFFSRLASFRFNLKRGAEEKAKLKKKTAGNNAAISNPHQQRIATKDDYIYIPLKGPPAAENNNHRSQLAAITAKPPLPKQPPPRVVHASVKAHAPASANAHASANFKAHAPANVNAHASGRSQRRRTIDCAVPMEEPMGLIETDLDTEVTVITSGANAKTRSLLDLGPQPRRLNLAPGDAGQDHQPNRPHKSMEFLLDKQNLRVVEEDEEEDEEESKSSGCPNIGGCHLFPPERSSAVRIRTFLFMCSPQQSKLLQGQFM
ncbi:unnamed protein product [Phaedon cochleariae]|uniref:Uncharacterized protein n=1 Tax=Phaedon cochleariae TaxID=80249 RepID=A0A9N9SFX9_PHACE|nr:unnamed protein product [Phaedon cochleariae]